MLGIVIAGFAAASFSSCASQKPPPQLIADPDHGRESQLPWNKQEKWEIAPNIPQELQGRN